MIGLAIGFGGGWLARRSPSSSSGLFAIGIVGLAEVLTTELRAALASM